MGPRQRKRTCVGDDSSGNPENAVIVVEAAELVPPTVEYTEDELRHFAESLPPPTEADKQKAGELVAKQRVPGNHAASRIAMTMVQSRHGAMQMPWTGSAEKFLGGVSACLFFFSPLCVEWNLGCQPCKLDRRAVRQQEGVSLSLCVLLGLARQSAAPRGRIELGAWAEQE